MGTTLGKPFAGFFQENEPRIVLFGLDGTGKSSIVHMLETGEVLTTDIATIGFEFKSVKYKDSTLNFWELGGQQRYRSIAQTDRIEEAKDFLNTVFNEIQGNVPDNAAVLVYGNKCKVPGAMSASEISNKLDLASLRQRNWQRNWHVQSSCAWCGAGLHEGLDWLLKNAGRM